MICSTQPFSCCQPTNCDEGFSIELKRACRGDRFISARKEYYQSSSRKPTIKYGSMEDDQKRRDFTVNAIAISLSKDNFGELIEPALSMVSLDDRIS